jgi:hypothetical protein
VCGKHMREAQTLAEKSVVLWGNIKTFKLGTCG